MKYRHFPWILLLFCFRLDAQETQRLRGTIVEQETKVREARAEAQRLKMQQELLAAEAAAKPADASVEESTSDSSAREASNEAAEAPSEG